MSTTDMTTCPRCGHQLVAGFAAKAAGLSFIAPDKFKRYVFLDEDLGRAGWSKLLPSKAEYFRSYLCRGCELYMVDYGTAIGRADATEEAEALAGTG